MCGMTPSRNHKNVSIIVSAHPTIGFNDAICHSMNRIASLVAITNLACLGVDYIRALNRFGNARTQCLCTLEE
jgi:hypothetical protein